MPEETENWWEIAPEESDPDAPAPIAIRGYQAVDGKLVQKPEGEGSGSPGGDPNEWSAYSKQKAAATGIFLFTFIVGDWWWDGSNGFGAIAKTPSTITEFWPEIYSWAQWHPYPIIVVISWVLWDITPTVFLLSFLFGSHIIYSTNMKEDSWDIRRVGKKAHRNLKYFVSALILMDFLALSTDPGFPIFEYPILFFEIRPGIYWMLIAFGASFGLNPDNERLANVMNGSHPK